MGRTEYIYVIKSGVYYKIGKTTNIKQRMKALQYANPIEIELTLLQKLYHCSAREEDLQDRFNNRKVRGEWFQLTKKDIKEIQRILSFFKKQDSIEDKIKKSLHERKK